MPSASNCSSCSTFWIQQQILSCCKSSSVQALWDSDLLLWTYDFCEPQVKLLWYKGEAIVSEDSPLMKSKCKGRFSEPRWEVVFSGTSKEFGREEPVPETNIPCGRYKSCFPELVTCLHFTVPVAHQDLSQQKSVSKVPLTSMGSKQVLICTWPQNSSRQRSSPAQQSSRTQPKRQRSRHGALGRDQSSQTMRTRAEGQSRRNSTPRECSTDQ